MKKFDITVPFDPVFEITARVEPYNEDAVDPSGFLALEGGAGLLLQEDGESLFLLEGAIIPLTIDSTTRTIDSTLITIDQTFILDVT